MDGEHGHPGAVGDQARRESMSSIKAIMNPRVQVDRPGKEPGGSGAPVQVSQQP
jgi:hypothetical protein